MTVTHSTVEELVRARLAQALGGRRGVVESAVPTVMFTVTFIVTDELRTSLVVSVAATVLLLAVRLLQKQTVQFVLNALIGIGIAAFFASRSGDARDFFLPGILLNAGYAAVLLVSVAVRWPVVGVMIGGIVGDPTGWREDKAMVRLCTRLTLVFTVPFVIRFAVQYPLYLGDHIALLGTTKVALGWPLFLSSFAAMAWLLSRDSTPLETDGDSDPA